MVTTIGAAARDLPRSGNDNPFVRPGLATSLGRDDESCTIRDVVALDRWTLDELATCEHEAASGELDGERVAIERPIGHLDRDQRGDVIVTRIGCGESRRDVNNGHAEQPERPAVGDLSPEIRRTTRGGEGRPDRESCSALG
ncbi:MAG: hypothetical protein R2710_08380 [Acidimicrobiales bacterium]